MANRHSAFLPMVPPEGLSHNDLMPVRRRDGSLSIVKGESLRAAEADILPRLAREAPDEPVGQDGGPLSLRVTVLWPTDGSHEHGEPMVEAPDWDNVAKVVGDLLQRAGWISDDRQICEGTVVKAWSDLPGIHVDVATLTWRREAA